MCDFTCLAVPRSPVSAPGILGLSPTRWPLSTCFLGQERGSYGRGTCPEQLPALSWQVCGSDGVTYANECELKKTRCEKRQDLYVTSQGACRGETPQRCPGVPVLCPRPSPGQSQDLPSPLPQHPREDPVALQGCCRLLDACAGCAAPEAAKITRVPLCFPPQPWPPPRRLSWWCTAARPSTGAARTTPPWRSAWAQRGARVSDGHFWGHRGPSRVVGKQKGWQGGGPWGPIPGKMKKGWPSPFLS